MTDQEITRLVEIERRKDEIATDAAMRAVDEELARRAVTSADRGGV